MNPIVQKIKVQKIIPLFYNDSFDVSKSIVKALYEAGIRIIEYTNRGEKALDNFTRLKEITSTEFPELMLGIGTVKNASELKLYADAKADFIITPVINQELIDSSKIENILLIPGTLTPSEVNLAYQNDLRLVKIFPADAVGKNYIKSIKPVFPGMEFMPTGGVTAELEDINEWLNGGAIAVGQGSALIKNDISLEELQTKVQELLNLLNS